LPKIVPKLYRYQFDPTPKIKDSMASIWSALVTEPTKTLDKYLPDILEEISVNLTNNQWRVRESCCMALVDLLRGRSLDSALDKLGSLWSSLFRVMDDIKESVRLAAAKAAESMSRVCVRMCDPEQYGPSSAAKAVKATLPPLLNKGLQSGVNEVQAIVVQAVVKISKNAGSAALRPHLPLLVPALIEAAGEAEGSAAGYLSVRVANDPSVQEKLDLARVAAAKATPAIECVNNALLTLKDDDEQVMAELCSALVALIKANISVAAKGCAAHSVTFLAAQKPLALQPHAGKILAALVAGLSDRNAAVRRTYAAAIGQLMRAAKDSSLEKLFVKLRTW